MHPSKLNNKQIHICYLAGKITGDEVNAKERFFKEKRKLSLYYEVIYNPFELPKTERIKQLEREIQCLTKGKLLEKLKEELWGEYMRLCVSYLVKCDIAFFLPDWQQSRGAKVEHQLCLDLGIKIKYLC